MRVCYFLVLWPLLCKGNGGSAGKSSWNNTLSCERFLFKNFSLPGKWYISFFLGGLERLWIISPTLGLTARLSFSIVSKGHYENRQNFVNLSVRVLWNCFLLYLYVLLFILFYFILILSSSLSIVQEILPLFSVGCWCCFFCPYSYTHQGKTWSMEFLSSNSMVKSAWIMLFISPV